MAAKLKILVASAPRSGGSWLYNAARLLLGLKGDVNAAWCEDYDATREADYHVVKAHRLDQVPFEPSMILTTHRDVSERLGSLMRMGWMGRTADAIAIEHRAQTMIYDYWKQRTNLEIEYEDIVGKPIEAVKAVAAVLDVAVTGQQAVEIATKLSIIEPPSAGTYDPTTLLHRNHRSDGTATSAIAAQIRQIVGGAK